MSDGFEPTGRVAVYTKSEAAFQELRARILDGSLEPGATIDQEAVATALGLSITPVREALRRLDSEGLVRVEAHRMVRVASLSAVEVRDLYAVRIRLDPFAAALAAEFATADELAEISAMAQLDPGATTRDRLAANRRFHARIYRASRNGVLIELLDRLWDQTDRYRLVALQDRVHERTAQQEHRAIAAALADRDAPRVEVLMRLHVEATLRHVEGQVDVG